MLSLLRPLRRALRPRNTSLSLAGLIDPEELDRIRRKRGATPRLREACYWLEMGRQEGEELEAMIDSAHELLGYPQGHRTREQKRALVENMDILKTLGCLGEEGLAKLRTGNAPTIAKGEFAGEVATVDHTLPRSICPELDNKLFNLRFMAESVNQKKGNRVGEGELKQAREWYAIGLLSSEGLAKIPKH